MASGRKWSWFVRQRATERGITTPNQLSEAAGIAPNTAVSYWYGRPMRIDLPILERVARAVGVKNPFDLCAYNPDGEDAERAIEAHPEQSTSIALDETVLAAA